MNKSIETARQRAEDLLADLQERAMALTEGDGVVAEQVRRLAASEPFIMARGAFDRAVERVNAIDLDTYVAQAQGYKTQAQEAATARLASLRETPAGQKVNQAWERVLAFAEQFSDMP